MTLERVDKKPSNGMVAVEALKAVAQNPVMLGLLALAVNQAFYKAGLWRPHASPDGKYRTFKSKWGFAADGFHLGDQVWTEVDPEEVSAENATIIGTMIIAATLAYAAKAPMVQPIIGVKT